MQRFEYHLESELWQIRQQLTLRFGGLSDDVTERVRAASADDLEVFAERVLTAKSVADVLRSD